MIDEPNDHSVRYKLQVEFTAHAHIKIRNKLRCEYPYFYVGSSHAFI